MPAVMPSGALPAPAVKLQAGQDFIGPMPIVTHSATIVSSSDTAPEFADDANPVVTAPPTPDFIGPMPAMTQVATAMPAAATGQTPSAARGRRAASPAPSAARGICTAAAATRGRAPSAAHSISAAEEEPPQRG